MAAASAGSASGGGNRILYPFYRCNGSMAAFDPSTGGPDDGEGERPDVQPAPDDGDIAYYVIVTDENGDVVRRIPVQQGQDTTIVGPEDDRAAGENQTGE